MNASTPEASTPSQSNQTNANDSDDPSAPELSASTICPDSTMYLTGFGAIILGGLIAAVTDPVDLYRGSWTAAYLVLVVGASQVAMGAALNIHNAQTQRWAWTQFGCWNTGSATVILGTLSGSPEIVTAGSIFLVVALALALNATRKLSANIPGRPWILAHRVMLGALALSIPVGIALSYLRHT